MSLLQQIRNQKLSKSNRFYNSLLHRNQLSQIREEIVYDDIAVSRSFDIKVIDKNRKNLDDMIIKTSINRKRKMERNKEKDTPKNKSIVNNTSFDGLKAGFIDSKEKEKYIKNNSDNFKALDPCEMKKLFKIFLDGIN